MSIVKSGAQHRLRFGTSGGADGPRFPGVIIERRAPGGVRLVLVIDQPSELPQSDAIIRSPLLGPASNSPAKFAVESAPRPLVTAAAGGVTFRSSVRTLSTGGTIGNGVLVPAEVEPAWSALVLDPVVPSGGIVPKGRYEAAVDVPIDPNGTVPGSGLRPAGNFIRFRWLGTAVAGALIFTPTGAESSYTGSLHATRRNYAPGSIVMTATVGAAPMTIRDNGNGRLVGQQATTNVRADGTIDYLTGAFTLKFSANPDAVGVTANYEHTTLYLPLDIALEWDSMLQ